MNGKMYFNDLGDLADFLAAYQATRCTAVFEVKPDPQRAGCYVLEFTGGF